MLEVAIITCDGLRDHDATRRWYEARFRAVHVVRRVQAGTRAPPSLLRRAGLLSQVHTGMFGSDVDLHATMRAALASSNDSSPPLLIVDERVRMTDYAVARMHALAAPAVAGATVRIFGQRVGEEGAFLELHASHLSCMLLSSSGRVVLAEVASRPQILPFADALGMLHHVGAITVIDDASDAQSALRAVQPNGTSFLPLFLVFAAVFLAFAPSCATRGDDG